MKLFGWQLIKDRELKAQQVLASQQQEELRTKISKLEAQIAQLDSKLKARSLASAKAEAQRKEARLEHMQTDFIAAASHELKTPLAGIEALGDALQMALEDKNHEAVSDFVEHIRAETSRMRTLTEDLLDLSRFDENPDADSVSNLRDAIESAIIMPKRNAQSQGIELILNIDESLQTTLLAKISPTDLSIILDNLLDNALHYTNKGSITVSLAKNTYKRMWQLEVKDTGTGISEEDQAQVFDRFYRADKSRSRDYGGTGLGLSLVKKSVERWGGTVELHSELGKGTSFILNIPVA